MISDQTGVGLTSVRAASKGMKYFEFARRADLEHSSSIKRAFVGCCAIEVARSIQDYTPDGSGAVSQPSKVIQDSFLAG
jgi:hypothetical protein